MINSSQFIVDDFAPESEKKTEAFAVKTMNNFWTRFNTDGFFNTRAATYRNVRMWAQGNQSVQELIDQTTTRIEGGEPNSTWANLDYSPPAILPQIIDGVVGSLMGLAYKVKCNADDPISKTKKLDAKNKELNLIKFKDVLQNLEQATGIPSPKPKYETEDEVEIEHENFKLGLEEAIEVTITDILQTCGIKTIQRQLYYDLVNLQMAVVRCYYDINYKTKFEYIDAEMYVNSTSLKEDFSDVNIEGHVEYITIGELKRQSGWDNKKLHEIAVKYAGQYGNTQTVGAFQPGLMVADYAWMSNKVMVLHFEFLTIDNTHYKVKENRYGKKRVYMEAGKDDQNISKRIQNVYCGTWIVGSESVYNYGMKENMVRKRLPNGVVDTQTQTGYKKYALNMKYGVNKSITERAIVFAKQWHLAYLTLQNFLLKSTPPGYTFNISGLNPIDLGGGKTEWSPMSMVVFHKQTSTMYYDKDGEGGLGGRQDSPFQEIKGAIGEVERLMGICNFNMEQIRTVCGRPIGVDASTAPPDTLVGVVNASQKAAAITLEPLRQSFTNIMESAINYLCMMVQDKATDSYGMAVGDLNVKLLEMAADLENANLGMNIQYEPDDVERQLMRMTLDFEVKSGNLRSEDAVHIMTLPTVKQMGSVMALRRKQYAKEKERIALANTQAQTQSNIQAAQASEAARAQTELAVLKAKEDVIWTQAYADVFVKQAEAKLAAGQAQNDHVNALAEVALSEQLSRQSPPPNAGA